MRSMGINGIILTQDAFTVEGYGRGATISLNTTIEKLTVKVNNLRKVHGYDSQGKILNAYIAYVPELGSDADLNQSEQHTSIAKSKGDTKAPRLHLRKHTLPLVKTPNSLYTLPVLSNKPEIAKFGERKRRNRSSKESSTSGSQHKTPSSEPTKRQILQAQRDKESADKAAAQSIRSAKRRIS